MGGDYIYGVGWGGYNKLWMGGWGGIVWGIGYGLWMGWMGVRTYRLEKLFMNKNDNANNDNGKANREAMIRRLDAEIDNGDDKERREERDGLRKEGVKLLNESRGLMGVAILLAMRGEVLAKQKDYIEESGNFEEMENWYKVVEEVNRGLKEVNRMMKEMESRYKELRVRVNKFYGIEVMLDYDDIMNKMDNIFGNLSSESTPGEDTDKDNGGGIGIDDKDFGFNIGGDDGDGFKEGNPDWWKN